MENIINLQFPQAWQSNILGTLIEKTQTNDPRKKKSEETIKYVDVSNVSNELYKIVNYSVMKGKEAPSRAQKIIHTNDVIFATVRPTLKRVAIIPKELENEYCSTGYCVLRAGKSLDYKFLYFYLITDFFSNYVASLQRGANYPAVRDSDVKKSTIPMPPLLEQKKIAYILSTVQKAMEQQEQILRVTQELKKALMHKLFTEGLKGEPQKQTEIGPIPESWDVFELGNCLVGTQYGLSVKGNEQGKYPILRMANQRNGKIVTLDLQYVDLSDEDFFKFREVENNNCSNCDFA